MSLYHNFYLLKEENHLNDLYHKVINKDNFPEAYCIDKVSLSDSLIRYIYDTLEWIPTVDPNTNKEMRGLNYYGMTVINQAGVEKIKDLLLLWVNIFSLSETDTIKLTEHYLIDEEKHEELIFDRNKVNMALKKLAKLSDKVSKEKNYLILHMGV